MKFKLIAGLGNPGARYRTTYHNIGFLALEYLDAYFTGGAWHTNSILGFAYRKGTPALLVKPLSFMNESGRPIARALRKFKIKPEEMMVIHDESDLPVGSFKFSASRGSAGHRGVQSIITHVGTNRFSRIRIGIRHDRLGKARAEDFVLSKILPRDKERFHLVFRELAGFIENVMENTHS